MLPVSCNDGVNVGGTVSPHTHTFWHNSFNCRLQTFRLGTVQHQLGRCCLCLGSSSCSFLQVRNKHLTARTVGQRSWELFFFPQRQGDSSVNLKNTYTYILKLPEWQITSERAVMSFKPSPYEKEVSHAVVSRRLFFLRRQCHLYPEIREVCNQVGRLCCWRTCGKYQC